MVTASQESPEEVLRPKDVQRILKIGHDKFYQLVKDEAFPVSRPSKRLLYVRRADINTFIKNGYPQTSPN